MVENLYIGNNPKGATELIKKFNADPDSNSGIVTVPKVIEAGESVTIPAGRVAVLPNVQVDGTLNIEGEVFIPTGATFGDLEKGLMPIGAILNAYTIFDNCIVAFGGEFNRADYPKLWEYIQGKSFLKSDAEWQDEATANDGICGFYSSGNGTTTFRVPNLDKAFLRPDSRTVGSFQGDAIRNISGAAGRFQLQDNSVAPSGVFSTSSAGVATSDLGGGYGGRDIIFNTSGVVPTANENRPKNIAVLPLIVAK